MTNAKEKGKRRNPTSAQRTVGIRCSVMVISNRSLSVSGCRRISEYSSGRVRLVLKELDLVVEGAALTIHTYCGDEIEIRGQIDAVYFGKKGG